MRPFGGKIRRIQKKQQNNIEQQKQSKQLQDVGIPQTVSKTPQFTLGKKKLGGGNKNIYDVLKKNQNNQNTDNQIKQSANLRPDLLKKKIGPKLIIPKQSSPTDIKQIQQQSTQFPKQTPFIRGKRPIDFKHKQRSRQRQKILIDGEDQQQKYQNSQENAPQQSSFNIRPDLKIKNKYDKSSRQQKPKQFIEEQPQQNLQQQPYTYVPIQTTQIVLTKQQKISEGKIQKQNIRTKQLKQLLNLEVDLYEQLLSISSITQYETYINKIKSGTLKNSIDQAFDEKTNQSSQTLSFNTEDFANQCPEDYQNNHIINDQQQAFGNFLAKVSPIIEELINPSSDVVMPPIFLLAFRPTFVKLVHDPYPIFIYFSQQYNVGIAIIGQKLYISQAKLNNIIVLGHQLVGGLDNGKIVVWNGKNNKSKFYERIFSIIQSTNFQLPALTTDTLQRNSIYHNASIQGLLKISHDQFCCIDEFGKLVFWKLQDDIKGTKSIDLGNILERNSIIGLNIKFRAGNLFIQTSKNILVWNEQLLQKLQCQTFMIDFQLPKRSNLVYVLCADKSFRIYDQTYSKHLYQFNFEINNQLKSIIIPEIEHQNRQLSILSDLYITDDKGNCYYFNLLENHQELNLPSKVGRDIINQFIYGKQSLQVVILWHDFKCKKNIVKMKVNLQKNVKNLKKIIESNRKIYELFQEEFINF